jgi:hypothetical protein
VEFLRADDQIHVGQLVEERGTAVLRHAAKDTENEVGILLFSVRNEASLADRLLLGGVAHGAGVEQHHVALVFRADDPVTASAQHRRDGLAVALVHLAPVGFDVDPVHPEEGCS